jgi:hypothetical protein
MVIALFALLVCASMFAIYAIVRTEERHLFHRHKDEMPPSSVHGSARNDSGNSGFFP